MTYEEQLAIDQRKVDDWEQRLRELNSLIDSETDPKKRDELIEYADLVFDCGPF